MNLSDIREKFVTELALKPTINSKQTVTSYLSAFDKFTSSNTRFYRMTEDDVKLYLATIRDGYSDSYFNVIGSAMKIAFGVINQPRKMNWFKPISTKPNFGSVISWDEFVSMGKRCRNVKHKLILVLLYSTGIRVSELVNIELSDILSDHIFIRSLKNGKNRRVPIHDILHKYIDKYFLEYNPRKYLVEGQNGKYSVSSIQSIVRRISNGKYHPHSFRHAFATEVIEQENVFKVKEMLGHASLSSTLIYYHLTDLGNIYNPLDACRTTKKRTSSHVTP